jgi:ABC-type transporter Mla maintaining outer membrane lipid asymmetry ATPase subunit MlaF
LRYVVDAVFAVVDAQSSDCRSERSAAGDRPSQALPPVIEIRGLYTQFDDLVVHRDIDLDIEAGQMLGLVGGSGSGKTTLLREMVGLLAPSRGTRASCLASRCSIPTQQRRRAGCAAASACSFSRVRCSRHCRSLTTLLFHLRELHTLDEGMIADLVFLKLAMVELEARHARLMPAELSGGMVKRVALARALSLEPNCSFSTSRRPVSILIAARTSSSCSVSCRRNWVSRW